MRLAFRFGIFVVVSFIVFRASWVFAASAKPCGNGVCQPSQGEDVATCPVDCGSVLPTTVPTNPAVPTATPVVLQPTGENPTPTSGIPGGGGGNIVPTQIPSSDGGGSQSDSSSNASSPLSYPTFISTDQAPLISNNPTQTFDGQVTVQQGTIIMVEYSIDNGQWLTAIASDGSFDSQSERYYFLVTSLSDGVHAIRIRSKNSEGVYTKVENYLTRQVTIVTQPPQVLFPPLTPNPTRNTTPIVQAQIWSPSGIEVIGEVSVDGGKTWLRMISNGRVFRRMLDYLEDDNYEIIVRALDAAGNRTISQKQILVVDTIPPMIGGISHAVGPLHMLPDNEGKVRFVTGMQSVMTVSLTGGAITALVEVAGKTFTFERYPGTHLWHSTLLFDEVYPFSDVVISATDGAGNQTKRKIHTIAVEKGGSILSKSDGSEVENVDLTLFVYQPVAKQWRLWDGASYGQQNPRQVTRRSGGYGYMLPKGKYYLEARSDTHNTAQSEIFSIEKTTAIYGDILLTNKRSLSFFLPFAGIISMRFPTIIPDVFPIMFPEPDAVSNKLGVDLIGKQAPPVSLPDRSGRLHSISSYRGNTLLLTHFSLWSAASLEQMKVVSQVNQRIRPDEKIIAIALQETPHAIDTFLDRGRYDIFTLADVQGVTAASLSASFLPTHTLIDKNGMVKKIHVGVLHEDAILDIFR